jgi:hypothetical protein
VWIEVDILLKEGGGLCVSRDLLERAVHDALPQVGSMPAKLPHGVPVLAMPSTT